MYTGRAVVGAVEMGRGRGACISEKLVPRGGVGMEASKACEARRKRS